MVELIDKLIGTWNPISIEGAWFNGVDVHWCFCAIVLSVIIAGLIKIVMCFFK